MLSLNVEAVQSSDVMVSPALAVAPEMTAASCTEVPTGTVRVEPPAAVLGVGVASSDRVVATLGRSEEHTAELQARVDVVCRPLLENTAWRQQVDGVGRGWA